MKTSKQLLNNVIGQLQGIKNMTENDKECLEVLIQMKAARAGLNKAITVYLEENLAACAGRRGVKAGHDNWSALLKELVKSSD